VNSPARLASLAVLAAFTLAPSLRAQTLLEKQLDPEITAHINTTPAIDNHAHPILPPPADKTDRDFDALPVDNMEPQTDPVAWQPDNPELPAAWKALWNIDLTVPLDAEGMKRLTAAREAVKAREGLHYDIYVLDRANIGTMVANRVSMGPGLMDTGKPDTRFRWVPYNDALLFPFDNSSLAAQDPDKKLFFPLEDKVRARFLAALHLTAVPPTLDEYLAEVVTPTIERECAGGAIAEKFEIAYLRSFDFTDPPRAEAARVYADLVGKPNPNPAEYKILQDFLFRYLAMEAGRLGMAVHIHVFSGAGSYFGIAGGNPMLLEPLFNDPRLRHTNFVLLHGGWPFVREANALLQKPNVYLDLSQQSLTFPPRTQAVWLRELLETFPGKVLFGTDGFAVNDAMGWEESTWIAAHNCRQALALALTGMLADGEITRPLAFAIADGVLRGNATQLYAPKP
jgi:hypothetical protein